MTTRQSVLGWLVKGVNDKRNIVVIGASAGGIEAACALLKALPSDFPASLFIAQHVGSQSNLARVLGRCDSLPVIWPKDGEKLEMGSVYVAPPDHHLILKDGRMQLSRSPRENQHRPSVDLLFRSAARDFRSRVIAIVLSGALDDGAAGAVAVKARGGVVIVQDPDEALVPEMPKAVMRAVQVDYCLPVASMPEVLVKLVEQDVNMPTHREVSPKDDENNPEPNVPNTGAAPFTCPECNGPLYPQPGDPVQYECLVGHRFSPENLSDAHREALERSLLTTIRMLEERNIIYRKMASQAAAGQSGLPRYEEQAEAATKDAALLREILEHL